MRLTHVGLVGLLLILGARGVFGGGHAVAGRRPDARSHRLRAGRRHSEGGSVPLVLSFHGRGDNMQNFQRTYVHQAWPEAIVVYFQGLETRGGLAGWQVRARRRTSTAI